MSSAFGVISLCSIIFAVKRSTDLSGNVNGTLALAVFLTFLMALSGLVTGILAVLDADAYKLFPVLGIVLCSVTVISVLVMMLI